MSAVSRSFQLPGIPKNGRIKSQTPSHANNVISRIPHQYSIKGGNALNFHIEERHTMKEKEFTPLIPTPEREKCIGKYGVSVANGAFGGGRIIGLNETAERITVHFSPFGSLVQGELRGRMECEMPFEKEGDTKHPVSVGFHTIRCLIIEEGPESYLVFYPKPEEIIAAFRATKTPT